MTESNAANLPYRPGVGIMLVNAAGKVFTARRIDMVSEAWQMPQGGIDENESPLETAFRELEEEIGTRKADLVAETNDWLTYDVPLDLIPKLWGGRFRGQRQKWFLMRFTGEDSEINIETDEPEFLEWRWTALEDVPELIVSFKRDLYRQVIEAFRPYLAGASETSRH